MIEMEQKTLAYVSIDNDKQLRHSLDLDSIDEIGPLRLIHSILDEMKMQVLCKIEDVLKEQDDEEGEDLF